MAMENQFALSSDHNAWQIGIARTGYSYLQMRAFAIASYNEYVLAVRNMSFFIVSEAATEVLALTLWVIQLQRAFCE